MLSAAVWLSPDRRAILLYKLQIIFMLKLGHMKNTIIGIIIVLIIGFAGYLLLRDNGATDQTNEQNTAQQNPVEEQPEETGEQVMDTETVIGSSVEGNEIVAYHYMQDGATPDKEVVFIGGIHGGYSWNTSLVAYEAMDYLEENSQSIPANLKVTVIPVLNPDGLKKIVGTADRFTKSDIPSGANTVPGRFNGNNVDLNRNFDCDWQSEGVWQSTKVDGGSSAFSEPESQAIKNYVEARSIDGVVVWYSAAGGVFASSCHNGVSTETLALTNVFADASGYKAYEEFNFYEITGDMVNWLAKKDIPAISVLLTNHTDIEWNKNQKGIDAVLKYFAN